MLEDRDTRHQSMHNSFPRRVRTHSAAAWDIAVIRGEGEYFIGQSPADVAAYVLPESCSACCATTFISFSREENRCMISWMRNVMLRMVSIWARVWAERLPGSSSSKSEFPSTDVRALFRLCRISSMYRPRVACRSSVAQAYSAVRVRASARERCTASAAANTSV